MYSSRVWTVRPLGIFLDSFVEVFFGCCFAVALGLDPPDPDAAAARRCAFLRGLRRRRLRCAAAVRRSGGSLLFLPWSCVPLFRVFFARSVPRDFSENAAQRVFTGSLIMVHFELHHFCRHFDAASHTPGKSKPCGLFQSPTRGLWQKYQAFHSRMRSMSITAPQSSQKKSPFHSLYLTIMPPPRQGFRRGRARARRLSRRRCSSRSAA